MWAPRPADDDEAPIDLRKRAALQRDPRRPLALEAAIRRLHCSNGSHLRPRSPDEGETLRDGDARSRSLDEVPANLPHRTTPQVVSRRSDSCPDLGVDRAHHPPRSVIAVGGARKRKCFVPLTCGALDLRGTEPEEEEEAELEQPRLLPHSTEQPPYLLHVYDYYQQLVQRLRAHPPPLRLAPPPEEEEGGASSKMAANKQRPARALTGKHVKQGTGASLSTLVTLRQKIQERQQRARGEFREAPPPRKKQRHHVVAAKH